MSRHEFSGRVSDHADTFASGDWLAIHHRAKTTARKLFAETLDLPPSGTVLDVACGVGGWTDIFAALRPESLVVGFDLAMCNLQNADGRSGGGHLVAASVRSLPFRSNSFDVVFVANAMQHADIVESLDPLYELLKPGGRLIARNFDEGMTLLVPCDPTLHAKVAWAAGRAGQDETGAGIDPYVGRKLKHILSARFSETVRLTITPTTLEWPFTKAQEIYIAGNVRWLAAMARPYLEDHEFKDWTALADRDRPGCVFHDPQASYTVFDFCAELTRGDTTGS